MSNVFPFIARMTMRGDWTSGERARLLRMAEHLSGGPDDVDVAFGRTDEGDPWCVVLDPTGEVLVHVARVSGRFIIHHMVDGDFQEGSDFLATLQKFMGPDWVDDEPEVVVQLNVQGRKGQTLSALIIATTFFYATAAATDFQDHDAQTDADVDGSGAAEPITLAGVFDLFANHRESKAAAVAAASQRDDVPRLHQAAGPHEAVQAPQAVELAAAPGETPLPTIAQLAPPQPAQAAAAPPAHSLEVAWILAGYERVMGTDGDDVLVGGPGASLILAGLGDDHLDGGGAGPGEVDLLDGGAGNDTIVMAANTVASGGPGADTFLVSKPASSGSDKASDSRASTETPRDTSALNGKSAEGQSSFAPSASNDRAADADAGQDKSAEQPSLGIVLDYNQAEGDQIKSTDGNLVVVMSSTQINDVLAGLRDNAVIKGFEAVPGDKLSIDIDGDGVVDGVLLVGRAGRSLLVTLASVPESAWTDAAAARAAGVSLSGFIGLSPPADLDLF